MQRATFRPERGAVGLDGRQVDTWPPAGRLEHTDRVLFVPPRLVDDEARPGVQTGEHRAGEEIDRRASVRRRLRLEPSLDRVIHDHDTIDRLTGEAPAGPGPDDAAALRRYPLVGGHHVKRELGPLCDAGRYPCLVLGEIDAVG